jgi:hypothetical protein
MRHPDSVTEHAGWRPHDADTDAEWRRIGHTESEFSPVALWGPDADAVAQPVGTPAPLAALCRLSRHRWRISLHKSRTR